TVLNIFLLLAYSIGKFEISNYLVKSKFLITLSRRGIPRSALIYFLVHSVFLSDNLGWIGYLCLSGSLYFLLKLTVKFQLFFFFFTLVFVFLNLVVVILLYRFWRKIIYE
ncbi:MAG: hypothetical protein D6732_10415, partial [Methanobacteriota archaeon]